MDRKQKCVNIPEAVRSGIERYVDRIRQGYIIWFIC